MGYNNPTEVLIAATQLPVAIEAKLPAGAPKISATLVDIANKLPTLPNFPTEIPDLPAIPELPGPGVPEPPAQLKQIVDGVTAKPVAAGPAPVGGPAAAPGTYPKARYLM